ncbi:hypothetical protein PL321_10865 [Caloramator sp. mosi_1]|uniref:hypothetical protein n=1 Tax=Caloramator sp. mosi_1 TaxID=3023090 RepID=UPI00235F2CFA|nr:hypothetical protein [Caloramator sp. mosi_1]WDC83278.1 hypothetical protein PL321_10865 [Caloramator sp. mosi_1]
MLKILHITPHMGGGVGKVISELITLSKENISHKIVLLEKPEKINKINKLKKME